MKAPLSLRLLAAAAVLAAACEGRLGHRHDEAFEQSYPLDPGTHTVRLEVFEGALTIRAGEPGAVRLEARVRRAADTADGLAALRALDARPRAEAEGPGVLALRGPVPPEGLDRSAHRLITKAVAYVPPDLAVEARTGFGHMAAHDRRAPVRLDTGHGDLRLDGCHADAVLRTPGGVVIVQGHHGGLDLHAGKCQTVQVFVDEIGPSGLRLVTVKSGVQLHVPAGAAFTLEASTQRGRARNSFGIPVEPIPETEHGLSMRGEVAGGGPPVVIAVQEGNVSVRAREPR